MILVGQYFKAALSRSPPLFFFLPKALRNLTYRAYFALYDWLHKSGYLASVLNYHAEVLGDVLKLRVTS